MAKKVIDKNLEDEEVVLENPVEEEVSTKKNKKDKNKKETKTESNNEEAVLEKEVDVDNSSKKQKKAKKSNDNVYVETNPANEAFEYNGYSYYHDGNNNYYIVNDANEWEATQPLTSLKDENTNIVLESSDDESKDSSNSSNKKEKSQKETKTKKTKSFTSQKDSSLEEIISLSKKTQKEIKIKKRKIKEYKAKTRNEIPISSLSDVDRPVKEVISDAKILKHKEFLKAKKQTTSLYLFTRVYNYNIDYLASDFTTKMINNLFINYKKMFLPKGTKLKIELFPNDNESTIKVLVMLDSYYLGGKVIEKKKVFPPFWITGFGEFALMVSFSRPIEKKYRKINLNNFSYRETRKILNKPVSKRVIDLTKEDYKIEEDFLRSRNVKNSYIKNFINKIDRVPSLEWECLPNIKINWRTKVVHIYLKIEVVDRKGYNATKKIYIIDTFSVKAEEILNLKSESKIININDLMYLIALNAMYKNIKIFSYNTLYEVYKILSSEILSKAFNLNPITIQNLSTLKVVDFSKHYICKKKMFNDRLLHLMNLISANEEYYRMKWSYTVQKNPTLLYSEFLVKQFSKVVTDDLLMILKNDDDKIWKEQLRKIEQMNINQDLKDKSFYINNYNVLDISKNMYSNIESYLMGLIKEDKDEITRISKLGNEIISVKDENDIFTKKELKEFKKANKKINKVK